MKARIPLRVAIPIVVFAFGMAVTVGAFLQEVAEGRAAAVRDARARARVAGTKLVVSVGNDLAQGDEAGISTEIAILASDVNLSSAWLVDDRGIVIEGTESLRRGRPFAEIPGLHLPEIANLAKARREAVVETDPSGTLVCAAFPLALADAAQSLRTEPRGFAYLEYDLRRARSMVFADALRRTSRLALIVLAASLGAGWIFRRLIVSRLARLSKAAAEIASGRADARSGLEGDDEIARLGIVFDRMAASIQARGEENRAANERLLREMTERRRAEQTLESVLRGTARAVGEEFFRSLVLELAGVLSVRHAYVARLLPGEPRRARTLALASDGALADPIEYDLEHTPCDDVTLGEVCFYPKEVRSLFPLDGLLAAMGADSYLGVPVTSSQGEPLGLLVVIHDGPLQDTGLARQVLTIFAARAGAEIEAIESDRALRESEERYRMLLGALVEGVVLFDAEGRIVTSNESAERILGRTREEMTAAADADWGAIHEDGSPFPPEEFPIAVTLRTGRPQRAVPMGILRGDGSRVWITISTEPLGARDGGPPTSVVVSFADVTERRRADEARAELEAKLLQSQKLEAVGTLAGGIAHDFNNLLAAILASAELLDRTEPEGSPRRRAIDAILRAADRARSVVAQILTFSRRGTRPRTRVDLRPIVEECVGLLRASLPATIEVRTELTGEPAWIVADPTEIHQVLMNLGTNAGHAMEESGGLLEIREEIVRVEEGDAPPHPGLGPGAWVRLSVRDTGHGMDLQTLERIYDPFFTTKPQGKGTGLGLAVVHGIVEGLGGGVTAESVPGKGTTFRVWIPGGATPAAEERTSSGPAASGNGERVLLVDDEPDVAEAAAALLEACGYRVRSFTNPVAALGAFREVPDEFDLVLTDLTMPLMTGADVLDAVRALREDVPVVVMTGFAASVDSTESRLRGFAGFLAKPFTLAALQGAIRGALDGH